MSLTLDVTGPILSGEYFMVAIVYHTGIRTNLGLSTALSIYTYEAVKHSGSVGVIWQV